MPSNKCSRLHAALLVFVVICCALPLGLAQEPPQTDDDEKITPTLTVMASLDENATLQLRAFVFAPEKTGIENVKPALETAFACTLKDSRSFERAIQNAARRQMAPRYFSYSGGCRVETSGSGLVREYRLLTPPLREYARHNELRMISIVLTLPDTEIRETIPPSKNSNFSRQPTPEKPKRHFDAIHNFAWNTDSAVPEFVAVRFGYDSAAALRRLTLPAAAFASPILLALWLRRRALAARFEDKPSVWFSYIRCQQWLLNGSLLAWWAAAESSHLNGVLRFLLLAGPIRAAWFVNLVSTLVDWLPPAAVWVLCMVISQRVQEKLRGLNRTRKELALQAIYSLCSALLPILLLIKSIAAMPQGHFRSFVLYLLAAVLVKVIAAGRLLKLLGMQPQALSSGELRDAAFHMANRLGVKLQQIWVIPAGKFQMANAFARRGNTLGFTDYLLERMTRREVNYILGHELTHLRLKHLRKLSSVIVGCVVACVTAQTMLGIFLPGSVFLRYGLFFVIVTVGTYFWSRRFEFQADAGAVEATDDPQAAISALFKLSSLNMHPLQWSKWSEKWLTHPSTLRRAQAIAKKAGIPLERLPEIAQGAVLQDIHYAIPSSVIPGNKLHSSTQKVSDVRRIVLTMMGATLLIPTAFALMVKFVPMSPSSDRLVYLLGAVVTFAADLWLMNIISARRFGLLIPLLKSKLENHGVQVEGWGGIPVSLAPGALPRSYEGHMHWDLGFLFLGSDRICYWGEETRFSLRRDQISDIRLGSATPHLFRLQRAYLAWRDAERATCGVFSLGSAEPGTLLDLRRRSRDLLAHLLQWHKEPSRRGALGRPLESLTTLDSLTTPEFRDVTGVSPLRHRKPSLILKDFYRTAFFAACVAVVAGLPFHILDFFAEPQGFAGRPHAPGSGWYVVLVAVAMRIIHYIPIFRYKEVPIVQASLPANSVRRAIHSPEKPQREPEPVVR